MLKKLSFITLVLTCIFGLNAMEQPRTVERIIEADDVAALKELVESKQFDPNTAMLGAGYFDWDVFNIRKSPLAFAAHQCSLNSVEYLLPIVQSDKELINALSEALHNHVFAPSTERDDKCNKITALLMAEARERKLDQLIQDKLDEKLFNSVQKVKPQEVKYFLSLGADRSHHSIKIAKNAMAHTYLAVGATRADMEKVLYLLHNYAPDLKTSSALAVINRVREGTVTAADLQVLPREIMELVTKLVRGDDEVAAKWVAIGMPLYLMPEEQAEGPEAIEDTNE